MPAQFLIDTSGFKCAAVSCGERYAYENGERTSKQEGTFVEVCVINKGFEKLRVNLPTMTPLQPEGSEFPEGTEIEFDALRVRPYVNRQGRLAYTADAAAARIIIANKRPGTAPADK